MSCDLPHAGDYFTCDLAGVPVLVVRSENGGVRAFVNACRHRGSRVASGRGTAKRVFNCPYHAWTYDIDGRLLGQPLAQDAFKSVDRDCFGLKALPAAEACGVILVGASQAVSAIDVRSELGGLGDEFAAHEFESLALVGERESVWEMNWKQPYETFLEAYHIFALHRDTLAKEILSTPMLTDTFGPHGRGVLMGRQAPKLLERDESEWTFRGNANLVYWLFPNSVLSLPMTGHAELWQFFPRAAGRTRVTLRFYAPPPANEKQSAFWQRMLDFTMNVVTTEDFAQQEQIFGNLSSGELDEIVFGRNEPALIHYHESLDNALAENRSDRAIAQVLPIR